MVLSGYTPVRRFAENVTQHRHPAAASLPGGA
jgi:hypothetical protein